MTSYGGRAGFVALIAALVIACGGTAPSTSPPPTTPSEPPSSGPTSAPAPTPTSSTPTSSDPSGSPSAEPTGTPIPQEGWVQLAAASDASAVWAPDAAHILVELAEPGEAPERQQVQLIRRDGTVVRTYDELANPIWLDAQRFVVYRLEWVQDSTGAWYALTGPNGEVGGDALQGELASDALVAIDMPLGSGVAYSNGHGSLAVERFGPNGERETAVWSEGSLTEWLNGSSVSWSAAGDRLALVHPQGSGPAQEGPLEVVAWPGLATVWESAPEVSVSVAEFDTTGTKLAFPEFVERPRVPRQVPEFDLIVNVVDLSTGTVSPVPAPENGDFAWITDDRLLTVGFQSLQASVLDLSGEILVQESVAGPNVIASADGQTALLYDAELDEPQMQILRGDELTLLESPGLITGQAPQMARDGTGVLVVVRAETSSPTGSPATVLLHNL